MPSQNPTAAGTKDQVPRSADRSMAGISRLQTDAAVITPAANPVSPRWTPSDRPCRIPNTQAAPRAVPANGISTPYNASICTPLCGPFFN